jgi:hypothetical protein
MRSQWNKTRTQQPNKLQKIFKHTETEQHNAEWQWVIEEIRKEIRKFLESYENENTIYL